MLNQRLISGVILSGLLIAGVVFLHPVMVLIVLLLACGLAMWEFYALLEAGQLPHFKALGMVCGLVLVAGTWMAMQLPRLEVVRYDVEPFLLFLILTAVIFRQMVSRKSDRAWGAMAGTLIGILYAGFLFNFLTKLLTAFGDTEGRFLLLYLVVVVKATDIGAYFIGCEFGRNKLWPKISPAKTWEGGAGGLLAGLVASALFYLIGQKGSGTLDFQLYHALLLAPLLSITGILGDLVESLFKRAAGVKDSGTYIKGMGGFLDVLDSLLFTAPVLYIFARLFMDIPS
ncbi:MAG TPA: CDP-archaeol synthase [Kiritimatiellia bacterium]|nr:CDP-archaeol synthase [Kiritimatiellia bacterium]